MMQNLSNQVVLVSGGSSGIGLGIANAFADEGAKVAISSRSESTLKEVAADRQLLTRACDVGNLEDVKKLVSWTESELGPINFLVISAGTNVPKRLYENTSPEDFEAVIRTNTIGAFNLFHTVLPGMRERKSGTIFNIVSIAGIQNTILAGTPYCASKFAQKSLGQFANLEALPDGVRCTNIYPGETNTGIIDKRPVVPPDEEREKMVQPEDVGALAVTIAKLPPRATVPDITVTPPYMPMV